MSEEVTRIYAENLMFEMKRPCMTPIDVKLSTGGITKHCCWTCYNCKTARGIILEVTSSLLANLTAKVGELPRYEPNVSTDRHHSDSENITGDYILRADVMLSIMEASA